MNGTYIAAALEVVFSIVGLYFGWLSPAEGSALLLAGIGVFGARKSIATTAGGMNAGNGFW